MDNGFGLEYHLVDSCNLKCAGCSHYSSLIDDKIYIPVETIINDLSLLKDKVGDNLKWLRLLGGEPLTHPKISDCLEQIRDLFPNINIFLVTNGLLLEKMQKEFYDVCIKCRIRINVTKYNIANLSGIVRKLRSAGVSIIYHGRSGWWHYQHIRLTEGKIDCLKNCKYKSMCNNYRNGKIYLCPHIAYVEYFNKRFDKNIQLNETDYISLNEINSFDELMEKLENARPDFCYKYCNYYDDNHPKMGKWKRTENDINEFCLLE